jgi:hypothetical protein
LHNAGAASQDGFLQEYCMTTPLSLAALMQDIEARIIATWMWNIIVKLVHLKARAHRAPQSQGKLKSLETELLERK